MPILRWRRTAVSACQTPFAGGNPHPLLGRSAQRAAKCREGQARELQASAENLSDLLEIESSLSDVQYQIESWQSQLDWYSQQVSCSTVYLSLDEVKEYTPTEGSYLSQLSSALRNGWTGFVSGIQQLTVWVVGVWPVLVILAAAALVVRFVRRRTRK